jgi:hypothetical protein
VPLRRGSRLHQDGARRQVARRKPGGRRADARPLPVIFSGRNDRHHQRQNARCRRRCRLERVLRRLRLHEPRARRNPGLLGGLASRAVHLLPRQSKPDGTHNRVRGAEAPKMPLTAYPRHQKGGSSGSAPFGCNGPTSLLPPPPRDRAKHTTSTSAAGAAAARSCAATTILAPPRQGASSLASSTCSSGSPSAWASPSAAGAVGRRA